MKNHVVVTRWRLCVHTAGTGLGPVHRWSVPAFPCLTMGVQLGSSRDKVYSVLRDAGDKRGCLVLSCIRVTVAMFNLLGFARGKRHEPSAESSSSSSSGTTPTVKRYFLAPSRDIPPASSSRSDPTLTPPALVSLSEPPRGRLSEVQASTLLFSLTYPDPSVSPPTAFFLECLPDPIGFIFHAACFIRARLSPSGPTPWSDTTSQSGPSGGMPELPWRHQMIELELEDKPGLAATMGGKIAISLHWVADIMHQVRDGRRSLAAAAMEFKGVCGSTAPPGGIQG